MLTAMRSTIRNTDNGMGGGVVTSLLTMLLSGGSLGSGMRQVLPLCYLPMFDVECLLMVKLDALLLMQL